MKTCFLFIVLALVLASCKKDELLPVAETPKGVMRVEIDNHFDTLDLVLDNQNFILDNGDKLKISKFKYYISNIRLTAADGSVYTEADSYYLIDEADHASQHLTMKHVPLNNYTSITFLIGVDSIRNVSGSQTGALSPDKGMFWAWNTGYIMAKLEGSSQQSAAPDKSIGYHIGGFAGVNSALRTVTISFNGAAANVTEANIPELFLKCNVKEWFMNPNTLDLSTVHTVTTVTGTSRMIADNYADMFSFGSLHN